MHAAVIFALVQFLLAITWTIYVAFLPQLAVQSGIAKEHVAWLLLMDQAIFIAMDFALGVAADRIANAMRYLGGWILGMTVISCAAFALLPRSTSPGLLLGLAALWTATSSALRAPLLVMIARRIKASASPFFVASSFFGLGIANALAPILAAQLRGLSPALPFIVASAGLAIAVAALNWAEKSLSQQSGEETIVVRAWGPVRSMWLFFAATVTLALGFQVHTALNSAPVYLKFSTPSDLERLMPTFWIGFTLCVMLPGSAVLKRFPAPVSLLAATVLGALVLFGFVVATSFAGVLAAQCAAGGLWGVIVGTAANASIEAGRVGHEGRFTGLLFALFALAAFARIGIVAAGMNKTPDVAVLLPWLPAAAWGTAAILLILFVVHNLAQFVGQEQMARGATSG